MRLIVSLICTLLLLFGQIVAASPRDDAQYIAEHMLSEGGREWAIKAIAGIYVSYYTKELDKLSVKVLDTDHFAEMIPMNVVEPWVVRWQEHLAGGLLKVYTPAQLAQIANNISTSTGNSGTSQAIDDNGNDLSMGIFTIFIRVLLRIQEEIEQSPPKLNEAPYLADILETDGIVHFPNRIWRKDLIAKIRGGG